MKSKMSFFDPTLLKKNIGRFAPAWAILQVAMFLAFPMTLMLELANMDVIGADRREVALRHLSSSVDAGVVFAVIAALLFAALVFKYLHSTKAAYMMHAFPMTRNCMYVTNLVSGLLFYLVPALVTTLCCLGVLAARGVSGCDGQVWGMFLFWTLQYLFFYGLAVFTMHISGRTVISVLSYAALNFVFLLIPVLIMILLENYFYGFDYWISDPLVRLAPAVALLREEGPLLGLTAVYGGIGVVLLILAWVHYRVRQVERAGDAMVYTWARIAFRLIFTLCCALGLGWILAAFFSMVASESTVYLPYALLGCFLGWFGSTMMLERTIKVFKSKKTWLGFAIFAAVLILFVACLKYDLLGFQRRVPETARVESVDIWTDYRRYSETDRITITDAAQIDKIREIHTNALKARDKEDQEDNQFLDSWSSERVHIQYKLKNGTTVRRCYELTEEKDIQAIGEFYADPAVAAAWYDKVLPKTFRNVMLYGNDELIETDEYGNEYYGQTVLECRDISALRAAMIADAAAGRLPISNGFNGYGKYEDEVTYYNLEFYADQDSYWYSFAIPETATETLRLFR